MGWLAAAQEHEFDNRHLVTFTKFIAISLLRVFVYPWEYWRNVFSGEEIWPQMFETDATQGRSWGAGGANRPGHRVEGTPMKPTIFKKLLFYRIILVCFSKKLLIDVLAPPIDKKQIRSSKNMEILGPDDPPTLKIAQLKIWFVSI